MALTGGLLTVTLGVLALEGLDGWRMFCCMVIVSTYQKIQ